MPYNFKIDTQHRLVDVVFFGRVSGNDVNAALSEIFHHKDWKRAYNHIWDGSKITVLDFGYSEFNAMKKIVQNINFLPNTEQGCTAVIIPNRTGYMMARAGQAAFPSCKPFGIFKQRSAAESWIRLYDAPVKNIFPIKQRALWRNA